MKKVILSFLAGGIICATVTGFAVEYAVTANPFPVKVNGQTVQVEGYNINDSSYFKLRDIADAVGGFEVGFEDNAIIVNTPSQPTATPAPTPANLSASDITIVKGDDGNDYTSDGLKVEYVDDIAYVWVDNINGKMRKMGINNYICTGEYLINQDTVKQEISNIPICPSNKKLIQLDFYISTLSPYINNIKSE